MAQNNEPAQRKLLGSLTVAIFQVGVANRDTPLRVEIYLRDQDGKPWPDTSMFRACDMVPVADAALRAYEHFWRQIVPAQPDTSDSQLNNAARPTPGRSNWRH